MRYHRGTRATYNADLLLAWCLRLTLLVSGLAILASLVACKNGGDIDLVLKGSAAGKPPVVEAGKAN